MIFALLSVHMVACIALLLFAALQMRRGVTLLNVFVVIFTLCCCLGVNFFGMFAEYLPPVQYSDTALARAATANLIFLCSAAIALAIESRLLGRKRRERVGFRSIPHGFESKVILTVASLAVTGYLVLWLGKMGEVENPFAVYKETGGSGQYYKYRKLIEEEVAGKAGQGTFTAKKLSFNVGPFLMILLAYLFYKSKNWLYVVLLVVQSIPAILVAGILAHKSYLIVALCAPFIAMSIWKLKGVSAGIITLVLLIGFLVGGTLVFHATLNSTIGVAFSELISRVFLVPAFTPLFYYEVVPDALPFRGVLQSLYIYHVQAPAWDYSIYDVAHHATGIPYGANANFLAVAFTGAGFFGVLGVVMLCLAIVVLFDFFLMELEPSHRLVAICCSGFGFIGIISINFLGALENGFLLGSVAFYALCRGVTSESVNAPLPEPILVTADARP